MKFNNCGEANVQESETVEQNVLTGKKYDFCSTRGMGVATLPMTSSVEVGSDRLYISISPKKKNYAPEIMLENIVGIELSKKVTKWHIVLAILAILNIFLTGYPWFIFLAALLVWVGVNTEIRILQRNGVNAIIYSNNKADAETFKEEMRQIVNIQ